MVGVDVGGTLISYSGTISTVVYSIAPAGAFRIVGGWGLPTLFVSGLAAAAFGLLAAVLIPVPSRAKAVARRRFEAFILPESLLPAVSMGCLGSPAAASPSFCHFTPWKCEEIPASGSASSRWRWWQAGPFSFCSPTARAGRS